MKKIFYIIAVLTLGVLLYSCEDDFLNRTPQDQITDPDFWQSTNDLELYLNRLYEEFGGWQPEGGGFAATADQGTDITLWSPNRIPGIARHYDGLTTVPASGGGWSWGNVRKINHFLANVDRVKVEDATKDHLVGEGHYFRAYFYFELLKRFGGVPIYTKPLGADDEELYAARNSRTEVVDFILSDLDVAIENMKYGHELAHKGNRLSKDVALMFKARVSLYEGTWEKYHQGTPFAGDTDGTKYLEQAVAASKRLIDEQNYSLIQGDTATVYFELFNKTSYIGHPEVIFFKNHDRSQGMGNQIWNWPNGYGYTREALRQFLCVDGQPIEVSPLFKGDTLLEDLPVNRDPRLVQSVMIPGDPMRIAGTDTTFFDKPWIYESGSGYESKKFRLVNDGGSLNYDQDYIHMRFAEALLIYAEARAELGQLTQADVDLTINQLRDRVGMPHLQLDNIAPDPNWPDYGYTLPDYLYEIRRERMVELFMEGYRHDDLFRWRAHNLFAGKRFTGVYYTDEYREAEPGLTFNEEGFIDPQVIFLSNSEGFGFRPDRDYLFPLPTNELILNTNLDQNPNWEQ